MNKIQNQKSTRMVALMLMGLMLFSITGVLADDVTNESFTSNDGSFERVMAHKLNPVQIKIISEDHFAEYIGEDQGVAYYKVLIKDYHQPVVNMEGGILFDEYKYQLSFEEIDSGLEGSFELDSVILKNMGETIVELKVLTKNPGASGFIVKVEGEGEMSRSKGIIVLGKEKNPIQIFPDRSPVLFYGEGFILSADESEGETIKLKMIKQDEDGLFGSMIIGEENFKVIGGINEEKVEFRLFEINLKDVRTADAPRPASFKGTLKQYENFKLLKGKLTNFNGEDWSLTATYNDRGRMISIDMNKEENVYSIGVESTISIPRISDDSEEEGIYLNPIKIRERRIFGFIPTGEKLVEIEVIKGNRVFTKTITEYNKKEIEGYTVSVGSLVDEDNIEFNISSLE